MSFSGSSAQTTTTRSAELFSRARNLLPGGVSRNAVLRDPHPVYADHAQGYRVVDIEGVTRIDFANNMASLIHGHACPQVMQAVIEQLGRGTAFTLATEVEVRFAEHLRARNPNFEKMRFVNSGTEAIMVALKAARAFTGRSMIAKAEGAYHGIYDYAEVSQSPSPADWGPIDRPNPVPLVYGTPLSVLDEVAIVPFNDVDRTLAILDAHRDRLACVLLDLMPHRIGLHPANPEFVAAIREWTARHGVLLVLDEVITFRSEYGGLQTRYGVTPDLTALGKIIGGGFPIGAVAGRADIMDVLNPHASTVRFPHSGTFSANPISMTAGLTAMELFDPAAVTRLNTMADRARAGINRAIRATGVSASVAGYGSMFRVHMKPNVPSDFREAHATPAENQRLKVLLEHLFELGFILINSGSATLSTPMAEAEIDTLVEAFHSGFDKLAAMD
ncbi:MAG: aspartate aminotransferase family protein [Phycisphaeraceae bacterium]|nr:aspartate aminotransferase family protein [Phycisphaeraceae bacterium]MCW5753673.1 aspartate aminotransferase family protein [Phycisphaeraceae bacterium]